jgi:hypothetical protein
MNGKSNRRVKQLIVALFTFLIGFVIVNDVNNMHVHRLTDGKMVIHAHPFNKTQDSNPVKKHHHSTFDFLQIQNAQLLFFAFIAMVAFILVPFQLINFNFCKSFQHSSFINNQKDRAPPVFA